MDAAYLSFAEQALRYFDRPHEAVARAPIGGPGAWRGDDLAADAWIVPLDAAAVAELERAAEAVRARGLALAEVRREDFPLPAISPAIARWSRYSSGP